MSSKSQLYILDEWQINPQLSVISKQGVVCQIEPKIMKVLVFLIHHANQVVSREEIIAQVWENRYASDEVITRAISILRKELAQHNKQDLKKYIKTVPKQGYTLEWPEPIDVVAIEPTPLNQKKTPTRWAFKLKPFKFKRLHAVFLAIGVITAIVLLLGFKLFN